MVREHLEQSIKKQTGNPILQLRFRRPQFSDGHRGFRRMERYYCHAESCWKAYCENQLLPQAQAAAQAAAAQSLPFSPWQAALDFTVSYETEDFVSIYLDFTQSQGGPPELTVRSGCTWNIRTGTPLPLSHFWPLRGKGRRKLLELLATQAEERQRSGQSPLDEDCLKKLRSQFCADHFYLSPSGIHVFFPLYSIASYGEGIPIFTLPRSGPPLS